MAQLREDNTEKPAHSQYLKYVKNGQSQKYDSLTHRAKALKFRGFPTLLARKELKHVSDRSNQRVINSLSSLHRMIFKYIVHIFVSSFLIHLIKYHKMRMYH